MNFIKSMLRPAYNMFAGKKGYKPYKARNGAWNPLHQKREKSKGMDIDGIIKDGYSYTENFSSWAAQKTFSLMKQVNRLFYDQRQMKNNQTQMHNSLNEILLDLEAVAARLRELEKKPKRGRPKKSAK